jgi:hypothetical protein
MYNLIIGFTQGQAAIERVLEYTDDDLKAWLAPSGILDAARLRNLPTLLMPELQDSSAEQLARVGHVEDMARVGTVWRFRFVANESVPALDTARIEELAVDLQIDKWEFQRTHWAVKDVDLYRAIAPAVIRAPSGPTVFRLPTELPVEEDLVAVMMPFAAQFDPVYDTIKAAVADAGMRCHRADDIWVNNHITEDIINLLWRARVVIADLTSKNANVFYETGIAHTLGRDTIQISQTMADVPFDLQTVRTLTYLNNDQGRDALRPKVAGRLTDLTSR